MDIPPPAAEYQNSAAVAEAPQPSVETGTHDLLINVLGTNFSITTGEDPAYLDEVLAQYRLAVDNTQGISGMKDPLKVAILTGFLLCDEINKLKSRVEEDNVRADRKRSAEVREFQEMNRILGNALARINKVIN